MKAQNESSHSTIRVPPNVLGLIRDPNAQQRLLEKRSRGELSDQEFSDASAWLMRVHEKRMNKSSENKNIDLHEKPITSSRNPAVGIWGYLLVAILMLGGGVFVGGKLVVAGLSRIFATAPPTQEQLIAKQREDSLRRSTGQHCLSGWDGSFPPLVRAVQARLRDTSSFEHMQTVVFPAGAASFKAVMTYRAKNGFGGLTVEEASLEYGSDCRAT